MRAGLDQGVPEDEEAKGSGGEARLDAVVISDLHLGAHNCLAELLAEFLEEILDGSLSASRLVINGDAFDSLDFRRLRPSHWKVLRLIRRLSTRIEVVWVAGNHDGRASLLSQLLHVSAMDSYVFESGSRRILACHGHAFDEFIDRYRLLTVAADWGYFFLQWVDPTHRVARLAKRATKVYLRCQERIARGAVALARHHGCQVAICGHTHQAVAFDLDETEYRNSGCWTERPPTYLAVSEGRVEVRRYQGAGVPETEDGPGTFPLSGSLIRGAPALPRPLAAGPAAALR